MAKFVSPDSGREVEVAPGPRQDRMLAAGWKRKDGRVPEPEPHAPDPTTPDPPEATPPEEQPRAKKTTAAKAKTPEPLLAAGPVPEDLEPSGAAPTSEDKK